MLTMCCDCGTVSIGIVAQTIFVCMWDFILLSCKSTSTNGFKKISLVKSDCRIGTSQHFLYLMLAQYFSDNEQVFTVA